MKERLGIDILISAVQVHGDKVLSIKETPRQDREIAGYDAIVTDRPIGIMIQQADCQAVPLFDRTRKVIGLAHSGWRGSVADIIGKTVKVMHTEFGSDPRNIIAAISPALGPCCAEFVNYRQELPAWMHEYESRENHFDFRRISRFQLLQAGIPAENIEISSICTRCNQDYFSYRREKVTGRFATVIALNKSYTHRA